MSQTIEAVYENGVFKPLAPVNLPEGMPVQVAPHTFPAEAQVRQQLQAEGVDEARIESILTTFRLAWSSYDGLTEEQKRILDEATTRRCSCPEHQFSQ